MERIADTPEIVATAPQITQLRDELIQDDGLERIAVGYASRSGDDRLLLEELHFFTDGDQYVTQTESRCRLDIDTEYRAVRDCVDRDMYPVIIHSHPFATTASFSHIDEEIIPRIHRFITGMEPEATVPFGVIGQESFHTATYDQDIEELVTVPATVVGDWTLDQPVLTPDVADEDNIDIDTDRVDRTVRAFTEHGQQQLAATHVGLVGAGGLIAFADEELARTGIGEITVIDPDEVEKSNLNRLIGATEDDIGRPKVDVVVDKITEANPETTVTGIHSRAQDAADALKQCDIIVAGVDRVSARMWLNQFAVRHLIPYVDAGVVIETSDDDSDAAARVDSLEGCIQFVVPGVTGCFNCLNRNDPQLARRERMDDDELQREVDRGYIDAEELTPEPAVAPLNGVVASKTVLLVSKWATGYAPPEHLLVFEDINNELMANPTTPVDSCTVCGDNGRLGRGDREPSAAEIDTDGLDLTATFTLPDANGDTADGAAMDAVAAYFAQLHPV